jgi:hemoglobin
MTKAASAMTDSDREVRVTRLVERFYELGRQDPVLAPIFEAAIHDWPEHIRIVADFWSHHLFGTSRYQGNPFGAHMRLDFPPEAFGHWLAAFEQAAHDTLRPMEAEIAVSRANHMSHSFRVGLFPYTDAAGRPSRKPPQ